MIGSKGDYCACPCCHPVDRSDHRDGKPADAFHDRPGHPGELEQASGVHLQQRSDDLVHVPTGAKAPPGAGQDKNANVVTMLDLPEQVPQVCIDLEGEGIELVGAVEGDRSHTVFHLEPEVLPAFGEACRGAKWAHGGAPRRQPPQ